MNTNVSSGRSSLRSPALVTIGRFADYARGTLVHPGRTFERLMNESAAV